MIQYTFIHNIILSLICYTYIFLIYKYKLTIKIIEYKSSYNIYHKHICIIKSHQ